MERKTVSLVQHVRKLIDPEKYYRGIFPSVNWSVDSEETRVLSPFIDEKVPSLSINKTTGAWYSFCATDERGGNSIISFHAEYMACSELEAAKELFHQHIHPVISSKKVSKWVKNLRHTHSIISHIKKRMLSINIVNQYKIGWNGNRIVFPVLNEFGLCVNARLNRPSPQGTMPKMINYTDPEEERSFGSPMTLYPIDQLLETEGLIFICEGEWDALALVSLGIPAVTSTAGAKGWSSDYNEHFRGRDVVIVYDNDAEGIAGAKRVLKHILNIVKTIRILQIPKQYGKDVSDYLYHCEKMRSSGSWKNLVEKTPSIVDNPLEKIESTRTAAVKVSLDQASQAKWFEQRIQIEALVTGKDTAPYILPLEYRISCNNDCEGCPLVRDGKGFRDYKVDMNSPLILEMLDTTKETNRRKLLGRAGIRKNECHAKIDYLKAFNVEHLLLIPTLDSESKEYVIRSAYYVGHGLHSNRSYLFEGFMTTNPRDQHITYLFDKALPIQGEIETFKVDKPLGEKLACFRPKALTCLAKLMAIAEWQSRNVTKILERPDLHIIVDLAFHSVPAFWFNKELITRGMLDILILGDTRCGKGYVTEKLSRYYGLGEVASGDNCSFAGLVGGLQQIGNNWRITWGLIPLNNKRLVVIDEASSLSIEDIGRMSRLRSEGVAEIVKIIRETTQANTRLIWLANPRSGRPILTYNTGVEAVRELVGAIEDISRFDAVLTLASNEVPSEIINAPATYSVEDSNKYPKEICRALVLWSWSRTPDKIQFTPEATNLVIKKAIEFGHTYSPVIPIIQAENARIKIAKLSAAVAARVFSTEENYERLIIGIEHVECACQILSMMYNKPSLSYNLFSKTTIAASKVVKFHEVNKALTTCSNNTLSTITGLLEIQKISADNLADYIGDIINAKTLIGELVLLRCLSRIEGSPYYIKNPEFTQWLRKKMKLLKGEKDGWSD